MYVCTKAHRARVARRSTVNHHRGTIVRRRPALSDDVPGVHLDGVLGDVYGADRVDDLAIAVDLGEDDEHNVGDRALDPLSDTAHVNTAGSGSQPRKTVDTDACFSTQCSRRSSLRWHHLNRGARIFMEF